MFAVRAWVACLFLGVFFARPLISAPSGEESAEFQKKLAEMSKRIDQSMKILRQQITENQSAPFLADLYLQLGDLLAQKANVMYYIQMEREQGGAEPGAMSLKKFGPVVESQKEAIAIYKKLLEEFPAFEKKRQVLYLMTLSLKSIDENAAFMANAQKIISTYPTSEEAAKTRLLMGQYFYEKEDYKTTMQMLAPVTKSEFHYERNQAIYRTALCQMKMEKFSEALPNFVAVITDEKFVETGNPTEINRQSKAGTSSLKREALIDSIIAYTNVYAKDPMPVEFYAKIAPTEAMFHEVIEKLAFRYINIKKYTVAVSLLRALSERTSDPQKVLNIYQEVLAMIPIKERINVKPEEMQFVLEKLNTWLNFYDIHPAARRSAVDFMEVQLRDLGTVSHDLVKTGKAGDKKKFLLEQARDFYHLYIGYFTKSPYTAKMAINLGDVYFRLDRFLESGDYYLRVFNQQYGVTKDRVATIQNAILILQKEGEYSFYEKVRIKGLLVKAIQTYMAFDPKQKNSERLNFVLHKATYDQGQYDQAIPDLYAFIKKHPNSKHATDAGELILDYYNTRSDYAGLLTWSDKLLTLKIPDKPFNAKLTQIREQARARKLEGEIKSLDSYDAFSEGKGYLEVAMKSSDAGIASAALQQALAKSKAEGDSDTFFKTAAVLASKEKDPNKKSAIIISRAQEFVGLGMFVAAYKEYMSVVEGVTYSPTVRQDAFAEAVSLALAMRDWPRLADLSVRPQWSKLTPDRRARVNDQLADLAESPVLVPEKLARVMVRSGPTKEAFLGLYKAQARLAISEEFDPESTAARDCAEGSTAAVCMWDRLRRADVQRSRVVAMLAKASTKPEAIEKAAGGFQQALEGYKGLEASGDLHLNAVIGLRHHELYGAFGDYLGRVAGKNPDLRDVLNQKAQESNQAAGSFLASCKSMIKKGAGVNPALKYCLNGGKPTIKAALDWGFTKKPATPASDPDSGEITATRKQVFVSKNSGDALLNLTKLYYEASKYNHAAAFATYGMSVAKDREEDFRSMLGCSVYHLGLLNEANYHLRKSSDFGGFKQRCLSDLQKAVLR